MIARQLPRQAEKKEISVPRSRRWIPIVLLLLLPIAGTIDIPSLINSAQAATAVLTGQTSMTSDTGEVNPGSQQSMSGRLSSAMQIAWQDVRLKAMSLKRWKSIISGPSVTVP